MRHPGIGLIGLCERLAKGWKWLDGPVPDRVSPVGSATKTPPSVTAGPTGPAPRLPGLAPAR
jgi:hypothetical protein